MISTALEIYFRELREIKATGAATDETSYYPAIAQLLNTIGRELKPQVRCVINIKNAGAGLPDGGFFTPDQQLSTDEGDLARSVVPARGVLEIKGTSSDVGETIATSQVTRYWNKYKQVLVTNYRDFVLVGSDEHDRPRVLESYRLAVDEIDFWHRVHMPRSTLKSHETRFVDFLRRVLTINAPLTTPTDLAWLLACYAREGLARLGDESLPAFRLIRKALEEALGVKFEGRRGDHFFRSTLIQTLSYGIFSAWVLWCEETQDLDEVPQFDWKTSTWYLHVPMIAALYHELAKPSTLQKLGLVEVLDWTSDALNRVDRTAFYKQFNADGAVQYFYEPFLKAFDPALRKDMGVWYTPPEIVRYMVRRVDAVLKSELGLSLGLADPNVYVLDPCAGTGSFLIETINIIAETLKAGGDDLVADDIRRAVTERVFGFEILSAPFVVAHLQVGLKLAALGATLGDGQRAKIFLTNSLTGWEKSDPDSPEGTAFPELRAERRAADELKQDKPILVILGNPPYNAFAGVSPREERGLVEPYKTGLAADWGIKKFNLDDLYVRFYRLAERRIAEQTGKGVVCFITNHSWIDDPSFVVMRHHLMTSFDKVWIDELHGDRKVSEYGPDGKTSETIFAMPGFSPGIKQGVAVALWIKTTSLRDHAEVRYRHDVDASRASERRLALEATLFDPDFNKHYSTVVLDRATRYSLLPYNVVSTDYYRWPEVADLFAVKPSNGLMEKRNGALVGFDRAELSQLMRRYFDASVSFETIRKSGNRLAEDAARYVALKARVKVLESEEFDESRVLPYAFRPLDTRWCYYSPVRPLWNDPRPQLWQELQVQNQRFIITRANASKDPEGFPFYFTSVLADDHLLSPDAYCIPFLLPDKILSTGPIERSRKSLSLSKVKASAAGLHVRSLIDVASSPPALPKANLSRAALDYSDSLGLEDFDSETIWYHVLAVGFSRTYLAENSDALRAGWPRIPMPDSRERLDASARLGRIVAEILNGALLEDIPALSPFISFLSTVARFTVPGTGKQSSNRRLVGRWGRETNYRVSAGPGTFRKRSFTSDETASIRKTLGDAGLCLGSDSLDAVANASSYWSFIPEPAWKVVIGGYPVLRRWLSYRDYSVLGRELTVDEIRSFGDVVRRIVAILLLESALDENFEIVKRNCVSLK